MLASLNLQNHSPVQHLDEDIDDEQAPSGSSASIQEAVY